MNEYFSAPVVRLVLCFVDKGSSEGPQWIENPSPDIMEDAVRRVFMNGKVVDVWMPEERTSRLRRLVMVSKGGECRLTADLDHEDHKQAFLEWWEPEGSAFRGASRYGDDYFDDRTVCRDVSIVIALFKEVVESNGLSDLSLSQFRSEWDPISLEGSELVMKSLET